jgi:hypothetical protein
LGIWALYAVQAVEKLFRRVSLPPASCPT